MKKSFMSVTMLVVSISMLAMFVCSSSMSAQNTKKFIYNKDKDVETVYTLDESGRFLTPKLKYEFKANNEGTTEKRAYRWNASNQSWEPYYLVTVQKTENDSVVEFALWNKETNDYSLNSQRAVYNVGFENDVLSYFHYNWNASKGQWEMNQHLLVEEYLALGK